MTTDIASPLCAEIDPELFFPSKGGNIRAARSICHRCDVRDACLEVALTIGVVDGIWAGTTVRERAVMRRLRGIVVPTLGYQPHDPDRPEVIARLTAQGWDARSIADNLGISVSAVHAYRRRTDDQAESA